ncbi:MAG: DUF3298 domain-containing protein [Chloroflexota bacterium]
MKRLLAVAALCALCIGGAVSSVSAQSSDDACLQKGGNLDDKGKCILSLNLAVSVDYPLELTQQSELVASTVDDVIKKAKDEIMQSVSGDFIPGSGQYELDITYATVTHSDSMYTLLLTVYQYQGGAHGGQTILPYTFDLKNNKLITLDDLFTSVPDALRIIEPLAQEAIKTAIGADMVQDDMLSAGTAPTADNYQFFSLDADSITFYFQQYQVGPYAIGIQTVTIPLAQLNGVLKPEFAA